MSFPLAPLRPPAGVDLLATSYDSREHVDKALRAAVEAVHQRLTPTQAASQFNVTSDDVCKYASLLGGRIGKSAKRSSVPFGTLRTQRGNEEKPSDFVDEDGVWHFVIPRGWSMRRRDLRRSYALIATTEPEALRAHAEAILPDGDSGTPRWSHYRDLRMTDQWEAWKLSELSSDPGTHVKWSAAWTTVSQRVTTARSLLHQALHVTTVDEGHAVARTITTTSSGWLDPVGSARVRAVHAEPENVTAATVMWLHKLNRYAENKPTAVLPSRLSHISDPSWQQLLFELAADTRPNWLDDDIDARDLLAHA